MERNKETTANTTSLVVEMVRRSGIVEDIFAPKTENWKQANPVLYDQNRTVRTGYGYREHIYSNFDKLWKK